MRIGFSVSQNQFERQLFPLSFTDGLRRETSVPIKLFLLAGGEIDLDGIDRRNRGQGPPLGLTRSPTWALAIPATPSMSEVTLVKPKLSCAVWTAAWEVSDLSLRRQDRGLRRLNPSVSRLRPEP